jgi:hypothetical protein
MLPYVSLSLFADARAFYVIENAAGLYPPSCFYLSIVLIELVLNAVSGGIAVASNFRWIQLTVFFDPERPWAACAGFAGFAMLQNMVTNVRARAYMRRSFGAGRCGFMFTSTSRIY